MFCSFVIFHAFPAVYPLTVLLPLLTMIIFELLRLKLYDNELLLSSEI